MVSDHINYLTFEDPASVNLVRRALKLAQAGDLYGAAETANVDVGHAQVVSEGLRRGMRYSIGAEVDNDPRARPDAQNIVDAMRPDGLIRSVHFIPIDHPVHGPNWNWGFDNPEFAALFDHVGTEKTWEGYMAVLLDAIDRLPGNIVGHFYVPAVFGHWPDDETLERYEDQMLEAAGNRGMAIEFNTRFLYRNESEEQKQRYLDANRRLLRKAKDLGIGIAVGSDAHSPRDQAGCFDTVLAVLDELEINEIVFPIGGRLLRVALRYVKPVEPEPPPAPPAPPAPEPVAVAAVPEPEPTDEPPVVAPVPAAAKPLRKARAGASSARPKETLPDRADTRHADEPPFEPPAEPAATAEPAAPAEAAAPATADVAAPDVVVAAALPEPAVAPPDEPAPAPVAAAPKRPAAKRRTAPAPGDLPVAAMPAAEAPVAAPAVAAPVSVKQAVNPPVKAVAKPVAKAAAKASVKTPAKSATAARPAAKPAAKPAPRATAKSAAKPPAKPAAKAKPATKAKPAAKAPAKKVPAKAAPVKRTATKAPVKKTAVKKAAPKKPVRTAKPAVKKVVAKKPARAAKRAPAKKAPARKPVAKKAPAKKSAGKRR